MKGARTRGVVQALSPFGDPIYARMSELADEHGAINLGQGFPSPDGPLELREIAARAIVEGPNQYENPRGRAELRQAIAANTHRLHGIEVAPADNVLVTAGAQEALFAAMLALVEPGDEVVVFDPVYATYLPSIAVARGVPRRVGLQGRDMRLDLRALEATFCDNTRAIIVNSPMNPTGRIFSSDELEAIAALCEKHDAIVIGDEVYEHLVYDGRVEDTVLRYAPGRALAISSFSKTFSFTGWRIGWVQGPAELVEPISLVHQLGSFCAPSGLQRAAAHALRYPVSYYEELRASYQTRRDLMCAGLSALGLHPIVPAGGLFVCVGADELGFESDLDACYALPKLAGIAAVPTSIFCAPDSAPMPLVRLCFAKPEALLREALARLGRYLETK